MTGVWTWPLDPRELVFY